MNWNTPNFEIGEIVALQSSKGNNPMTVENVEGEKVDCVWMDKMGKIRRDSFPKACLKQSDEADAHLIFMPAGKLNPEGVKEFLSGSTIPRESN